MTVVRLRNGVIRSDNVDDIGKFFQRKTDANGNVTFDQLNGEISSIQTVASEDLFYVANPNDIKLKIYQTLNTTGNDNDSHLNIGVTGSLNFPDILWSNLITSHITDMSDWFDNYTGFQQPLYTGTGCPYDTIWDTKNVTNMTDMFNPAYAQDLTMLDVTNVTNQNLTVSLPPYFGKSYDELAIEGLWTSLECFEEGVLTDCGIAAIETNRLLPNYNSIEDFLSGPEVTAASDSLKGAYVYFVNNAATFSDFGIYITYLNSTNPIDYNAVINGLKSCVGSPFSMDQLALILDKMLVTLDYKIIPVLNGQNYGNIGDIAYIINKLTNVTTPEIVGLTVDYTTLNPLNIGEVLNLIDAPKIANAADVGTAACAARVPPTELANVLNTAATNKVTNTVGVGKAINAYRTLDSDGNAGPDCPLNPTQIGDVLNAATKITNAIDVGNAACAAGVQPTDLAAVLNAVTSQIVNDVRVGKVINAYRTLDSDGFVGPDCPLTNAQIGAVLDDATKINNASNVGTAACAAGVQPTDLATVLNAALNKVSTVAHVGQAINAYKTLDNDNNGSPDCPLNNAEIGAVLNSADSIPDGTSVGTAACATGVPPTGLADVLNAAPDKVSNVAHVREAIYAYGISGSCTLLPAQIGAVLDAATKINNAADVGTAACGLVGANDLAAVLNAASSKVGDATKVGEAIAGYKVNCPLNNAEIGAVLNGATLVANAGDVGTAACAAGVQPSELADVLNAVDGVILTSVRVGKAINAYRTLDNNADGNADCPLTAAELGAVLNNATKVANATDVGTAACAAGVQPSELADVLNAAAGKVGDASKVCNALNGYISLDNDGTQGSDCPLTAAEFGSILNDLTRITTSIEVANCTYNVAFATKTASVVAEALNEIDETKDFTDLTTVEESGKFVGEVAKQYDTVAASGHELFNTTSGIIELIDALEISSGSRNKTEKITYNAALLKARDDPANSFYTSIQHNSTDYTSALSGIDGLDNVKTVFNSVNDAATIGIANLEWDDIKTLMDVNPKDTDAYRHGGPIGSLIHDAGIYPDVTAEEIIYDMNTYLGPGNKLSFIEIGRIADQVGIDSTEEFDIFIGELDNNVLPNHSSLAGKNIYELAGDFKYLENGDGTSGDLLDPHNLESNTTFVFEKGDHTVNKGQTITLEHGLKYNTDTGMTVYILKSNEAIRNTPRP